MGMKGAYVQTLQEKPELPWVDLHDLFFIPGPFEVMLFQSFHEKTKAVSVPVEDLEHRMAPVAKYKQVAGERDRAPKPLPPAWKGS